MSTRRVCVVTGSRAEYGLLRWVIDGIRQSPILDLQLIATGMHLAPEFGLTYRVIEEHGFHIDYKVDVWLGSDSPEGIATSMGHGLMGFGRAFAQLDPDLLVVLGDRFEIFSSVAAALVARIPVAHLHGGEVSEGAFDESLRHAITKMSHIHLVAAEPYRDRVIQLGEPPDSVFVVGGLGVDAINKLDLLDRASLEEALGFQLGPRSLLVTFHPATLDEQAPSSQMLELLSALEELEDTRLIITKPNADTGGYVLSEMIDRFAAEHPAARVFASLGQRLYLSCVRHVDGVVGNSSSGLTEVPTFKKGTINIGDRQRGRMKAESVIDCDPQRSSIARALRRLYSDEFQASLKSVSNPYGEGGASSAVVQILERFPLDGILKKRFFDLPRF